MHHAYPSRKASQPASSPTFAPRQSRTSIIASIRRRVRLRTLSTGASVLLLLYILLSWSSVSRTATPSAAGGAESVPGLSQAPAGQPNVVVVTVIDEARGTPFNNALRRNREDYAKKHGYQVFMPAVSEYDVGGSPKSWAKVPALRHALTTFPQTPFFLFVDDHTLIANAELKVEEHIVNKARIEALAIKDIPVVPPDSVIKTLTDVPGDQVDFVLVQDKEGLSVNSFVLRSGDWARFLLDAWFDPLYRSYNFQKAERHALEHIVQWHGTLLNKLALVPQDILSSYTPKDRATVTKEGRYEDGKFIVSFGECDTQGRDCAAEMRPWFEKLHGITI